MQSRNVVHEGPVLPAARSAGCIVALLAGVSVLGCGDDQWQAATHQAHGRVTVNGEPAAGAVVELHCVGQKPDARNSRPWAIVKHDGSFTLSTYEQGDGAPAGEYALVVRWPPDVSQPSLADRLGGSFARPEQSRWRVTIKEGENELPPVAITGAKVLSPHPVRSASKTPPGPPLTQ